jgi:hypothetical protein
MGLKEDLYYLLDKKGNAFGAFNDTYMDDIKIDLFGSDTFDDNTTSKRQKTIQQKYKLNTEVCVYYSENNIYRWGVISNYENNQYTVKFPYDPISGWAGQEIKYAIDDKELEESIKNAEEKKCTEPGIGEVKELDFKFEINLFDVLDKIKQPDPGVNILYYRLRQLFTFCQLPVFDTIHDMVIGNNLNKKNIKDWYFDNILLSYRNEMFNLIQETWLEPFDSFNQKIFNELIPEQYKPLELETEKTRTTPRSVERVFYNNPNVSKCNLMNLNQIDKQKIVFIKKYIFPYIDPQKDPNADMFGMFTLQKEYKTRLLGKHLGKNKETIDLELGQNISNIYILQALEILGMTPIAYNMVSKNIFFSDFIQVIASNQQSNFDRNFDTERLNVITTIDTQGRLSYLTNISPFIKNQYQPPQIYPIDLRTPAKTYDSAWIETSLFERGPKYQHSIVTIKGKTNYKLFFKCDTIDYTFCEFDLLKNGRFLKLYKFGNYSYNGLETGDPFAPSSSSNAHLASAITKLYESGDIAKARFISFFKFGGDFIQGIWQFILSYPDYFNGDAFNQFKNNNKDIFEGIKLHIATDGLSAAISSLFGGVVATTNTKYINLEGLPSGGTEFFFVKKQVNDLLRTPFVQLNDSLIIKSIKEVYKCKSRERGFNLTFEQFYSSLGNFEKEIIKKIIETYNTQIGVMEPLPANCDDDRMRYYNSLTTPMYFNQNFGKKRVKEIIDDYNYLLNV